MGLARRAFYGVEALTEFPGEEMEPGLTKVIGPH